MKTISRKVLSLILTFAMVTGMVTGIPLLGSVTAYADSGVTLKSTSASSATAYYNGSGLYKDSGCTEEVTDKSAITSAVILDNVTSIGEFAFNQCTSLKSIEIPSDVTSIGKYAFQNCDSLTGIEIPPKVSSIGYQSFFGCDNLSSITITADVDTVDPSLFEYCGKIKNLYVVGDTLPAKFPLQQNVFLFKDNGSSYEMTKYYGSNEEAEIPTVLYGKSINPPIDKSKLKNAKVKVTAYYNGSGLYMEDTCKTEIDSTDTFRNIITDIEFVGDVTSIGNSAFKRCQSLTSITIPSCVTSIRDFAFESCTNLTNISISANVTSIENEAFYRCTGLENISIPAKVTFIGVSAFDSCTCLTQITVDPQNTHYASENGVMFSYDKKTLICCPAGKSGTYVIPSGVISIGNYAFGSCTGLTSITIPPTVTSIGRSAFFDCTGLISMKVPNSISSIELAAFAGCTGLTNIEIPANVTAIGKEAFALCTGLNTVVMKGKVSSIGDGAFAKSQESSCLTFYVPKEHVSYYTGLLTPSVMYFTTATIKALENVTEFEAIHKDTVVPNGTALSDLKLPDSLVATVDASKQTIDNVTWVPDRTYNPIISGKYVFTAVFPAQYSIASGVELPKITITVAVIAPNTYTVSVNNSITGGSITTSPLTAKLGDTITLTVTPNTGKQLVPGSLKYNYGGKDYTITGNSFTMPPANVTVTAQFEPKPSDNDSSNHHSNTTDITDATHKNDTIISTMVTNTPTNTAADLSGATMPAGVTAVSLGVSQKSSSNPSDPQASNVFHAVITDNNLHVTGTPVIYDIKLLDQNGNVITRFTGKVKVKLPIPQGFKGTPHIFRFEESTKTFTDMNAVVENGFLVFETDHFSYYAVADVGDSITLDTTSYTMPVGGAYHIGMNIVGTKAASVKVYSTNNNVATAAKFKNGVCRVNGKAAGTTNIMYDVYDSKNKLLTHASVKINVVKDAKSFGSSARQTAVY